MALCCARRVCSALIVASRGAWVTTASKATEAADQLDRIENGLLDNLPVLASVSSNIASTQEANDRFRSLLLQKEYTALTTAYERRPMQTSWCHLSANVPLTTKELNMVLSAYVKRWDSDGDRRHRTVRNLVRKMEEAGDDQLSPDRETYSWLLLSAQSSNRDPTEDLERALAYPQGLGHSGLLFAVRLANRQHRDVRPLWNMRSAGQPTERDRRLASELVLDEFLRGALIAGDPKFAIEVLESYKQPEKSKKRLKQTEALLNLCLLSTDTNIVNAIVRRALCGQRPNHRILGDVCRHLAQLGMPELVKALIEMGGPLYTLPVAHAFAGNLRDVLSTARDLPFGQGSEWMYIRQALKGKLSDNPSSALKLLDLLKEDKELVSEGNVVLVLYLLGRHGYMWEAVESFTTNALGVPPTDAMTLAVLAGIRSCPAMQYHTKILTSLEESGVVPSAQCYEVCARDSIRADDLDKGLETLAKLRVVHPRHAVSQLTCEMLLKAACFCNDIHLVSAVLEEFTAKGYDLPQDTFNILLRALDRRDWKQLTALKVKNWAKGQKGTADERGERRKDSPSVSA